MITKCYLNLIDCNFNEGKIQFLVFLKFISKVWKIYNFKIYKSFKV